MLNEPKIAIRLDRTPELCGSKAYFFLKAHRSPRCTYARFLYVNLTSHDPTTSRIAHRWSHTTVGGECKANAHAIHGPGRPSNTNMHPQAGATASRPIDPAASRPIELASRERRHHGGAAASATVAAAAMTARRRQRWRRRRRPHRGGAIK